MSKAARELAVQMSHTGQEHLKALGRWIGLLKSKDTKGIVIRNPKVLKAAIFWDSNFSIYKETIKSVRGLVSTLGQTLLMFLSK